MAEESTEPADGASPGELGTAGAWVAWDYEQRARRERARKQARIDADRGWRQRARSNRPVLGLAAATVLHERRASGGAVTIDLLAVGPAGVHVIGVVDCAGRPVERRAVGWSRSDERLYVGGLDRTKLLTAARFQRGIVSDALDDLAGAVPVHGVLCFLDGDWSGCPGEALLLAGVTCTSPGGLPGLVEAPGPLGEELVQTVAARLAVALPPT